MNLKNLIPLLLIATACGTQAQLPAAPEAPDMSGWSVKKPLPARAAYAGQSDYMNFYHALALQDPRVDVSISALLSINGVLPEGPVTPENIGKLYPFKNTFVILALTGGEIRDWLEFSYDCWIRTMTTPDDPVLSMKDTGKKLNFAKSPSIFDSAAGINYTVDVTQPYGKRVRISSFADGRPFDIAQAYHVGLNSYRAHGSGGVMKALGIDPKNLGPRIFYEGPDFRVLLEQWLREHGSIDPEEIGDPSRIGRWSFIPQEWVGPAMERDLEKVLGK